MLKKLLQKKLKDQDLEKLKSLTAQFAQETANLSLTNSQRSSSVKQTAGNNKKKKDQLDF